jgi:predicted permease
MSRRLLVGAELALAVMLLIGAGLMLRSFARLLDTDSGMQVEHAGTLQLTFPSSIPWGRKRVEINAILDRLRASPGIVAAGAVNDLPLSGSGGIALQITADGVPAHDDDVGARDLFASPGYFAALGIKVIAGRDFAATDDSGGPSVAIISTSVARHYWPGQSPLGRVFRSDPNTPITVVGVVADTRQSTLDVDPTPQMYMPMAQWTPPNVAIVARGTMAPAAMLDAIRNAVRAIDPTQAVYNVRTMTDVLGRSLAPRRTNTLLLSVFAALAFVLAAVGVAAVVGYGVTQRRRELGIRSALGASGADLMALLSREMAIVATIGIAVGLAGAWALARVTSSLVYGVAIHDPVTFVAAPLLLLVAAIVATVVPARRALHVDPATVMRND